MSEQQGIDFIGMMLLQGLNPGYGTFGRPNHTYLPDWLAISVIVVLLSITLYFIVWRKKKTGVRKHEIEKRAIEDLLDSVQKERKGREGVM